MEQLKSEKLRVQFFQVNVKSPEQIQKAVTAFAEENQEKIHHLVNGGLFYWKIRKIVIYRRYLAAFFGLKGLQATPADFQESFDTNVTAYALMVQAVYPYMLRARRAGIG